MAKAVEWGVAAFRAAGIDVHTEKYTLPVTWSEGETLLNIREPSHPLRSEHKDRKIVTVADFRSLRAVSEAWGPPNEGSMIGASVVDVGYGSEGDFAKAGPALEGAIWLVHSDIGSTWADLFNESTKSRRSS